MSPMRGNRLPPNISISILSLVPPQIQFHRLRRTGEIVDHQNCLIPSWRT